MHALARTCHAHMHAHVHPQCTQDARRLVRRERFKRTADPCGQLAAMPSAHRTHHRPTRTPHQAASRTCSASYARTTPIRATCSSSWARSTRRARTWCPCSSPTRTTSPSCTTHVRVDVAAAVVRVCMRARACERMRNTCNYPNCLRPHAPACFPASLIQRVAHDATPLCPCSQGAHLPHDAHQRVVGAPPGAAADHRQDQGGPLAAPGCCCLTCVCCPAPALSTRCALRGIS